MESIMSFPATPTPTRPKLISQPVIFDLHQLALDADFNAVQAAFEGGADVNAFDGRQRSPFMCAIAGNDWKKSCHSFSYPSADRLSVIRAFVAHTDITLFTLNAPQKAFRGVTPLGMAAWLNLPDVVRILLVGSNGLVSVDGKDSHGATPLMYASRDDNLEVVQILLEHGAHPDVLNLNHRSAIQFSLPHPLVLYHCETFLRNQRAHAFKPNASTSDINSLAVDKFSFLVPSTRDLCCTTAPPLDVIARTAKHFIQSVVSSDLYQISSQLSSLYERSSKDFLLINYPDPRGWSAIHHCASVAEPSTEVLELLFRAGAEISLFTSEEHYTPLHCLARYHSIPTKARSASKLCQFALYLVRTLGAPLGAVDKEGETPIHIAAEHGASLELLMTLLACDTTKAVRNYRNSRGFTAVEVVKPHFRSAFAQADSMPNELMRPKSSASVATIRPTPSSPMPSSARSSRTFPSKSRRTSLDPSSESEATIAVHHLLDNLRLTSLSIAHEPAASNINRLENVVRETSEVAKVALQAFRSRTDELSSQISALWHRREELIKELDELSHQTSSALAKRGLNKSHKQRGSEDSEATAVCQDLVDPLIVASMERRDERLSRESSFHSRVAAPATPNRPDPAQRRTENRDDGKHALLSPSKKDKPVGFMKWVKRKIIYQVSGNESKATHQEAQDEEFACKGVSEQPASLARKTQLDFIGALSTFTLRNAHFALVAANRDLADIERSISSGQQLLDRAIQSITRSQRLIATALRKRQAFFVNLRLSTKDDNADDLFIRPRSNSTATTLSSFSSISGSTGTLTSQPSLISLGSLALSAQSSRTSLNSSTERDDEETRVLRRLLLRNIEARIAGATEEVRTTASWLKTVTELLEGIRQNAFL